jgi:hypothetical protein
MKRKEPEGTSKSAAAAATSGSTCQGAAADHAACTERTDQTDSFGHMLVSSKKRSAEQQAALQV